MIIKWYEVTCDCCDATLQYYIGNKPTIQELKNDGFIVKGKFVFCNDSCAMKYKYK